MMREIPIPNEPPLEEIAGQLLVGDCETIAERLCKEIQASRPLNDVPLPGRRPRHTPSPDDDGKIYDRHQTVVEKELGPLETLGQPKPAAQA
ncbi:MAG: hypothetical protein CM1200mP20_14930 [Pseudomonadota bacterium]|nr:MAG: hypothetical protein CM1200mP20_14930 [Pseudomonadota bacterium]